MDYPEPDRCPCGCEQAMCICGHSIHSHQDPEYAPGCIQCRYEDRWCPKYRPEDV